MKLSQVDECTLNIMVPFIFCTHSRNYNYINPTFEMCFLKSITLSEQSRKVVPYNTVSNFLTYGNTKSVPFRPILPHVHNKILVSVGIPIFIHNLKIFILLQRFRKLHSFYRTFPFINRRKGHIYAA